MKKSVFIVSIAMFAISCAEHPINVTKVDSLPPIYPDYIDVTIPVDIAPLNFNVDSALLVEVVVKGVHSDSIMANGEFANFDIDEWNELVRNNRGEQLSVDVFAKTKEQNWIQYKSFTIDISTDSLPDFGVAYRKIAPGYETFSRIGIYQRDIHSFDETPIVESTLVPGQCINCHSFRTTNPDHFTLHFRGMHGATLIQENDKQRWLDTKTDSTITSCMYPYWHPSGQYCAYSLNLVHQFFFCGDSQAIEVFDKGSDAAILNIATNELILSPIFQTPNFETYPVFSADGNTIYYCTSKVHKLPAEYEQMQYDLCRVSFDAKKGIIGTDVDTIIKASAMGKCITFPRPSYDGRFLMYSLADNGIFPINHKEADLWLLDLNSGEQHPLTNANSADTESFHSWSSNSRWFVFSSRRDDGMYSRLYISHLDTNGVATKPFMLPQINPREYYNNMPYAYNVPEFVLKKVNFDTQRAFECIFSDVREKVTPIHN